MLFPITGRAARLYQGRGPFFYFCCVALLTLTLLGTGFAIAYYAETAPVSLEDKAFAQNLLRKGLVETRFTSVNSEPWDMVCHLGGYETVGKAMFFAGLGSEPANDRYSDVFTMENEHALAFIDIGKGKARVVVMKPMDEIREISGPQCIDRENAHFVIEPQNVRGETWNRLVVLKRIGIAH